MPDAPAVAAPVAPVAEATNEAPAQKVAAKPPVDAKPAPAKLAKPFEFTHKGKKVTVDTEEKALHYMSKGFGASELFESANKAKADAEQSTAKILGKLTSGNYNDILEVLTEKLGSEDKALEAMEQAVYEKRVKAAQLTPEQRRIAELEGNEAKRKAADEARAKTEAEAKSEKQAEAELDRWAKVASDALAAAKVSPDTAPIMLARMRPYIDAAIAAGEDPVGADVLEEFIADERQAFRGMSDGLDGEGLIDWLGEEAANRIAKAHIQRLRAGRAAPAAAAPKPGNVPMTPKAPEKKRSAFWDVPPHRE